MEQMTYEQQCQSAAIAQGLEPYMIALTEMGRDFDLWQTGGWNMVLAIPTATADRAAQRGIFVTVGCDLVCVSDVANEVDEWLCALCAVSSHYACDHSFDLFENVSDVREQLQWLISSADSAAAQIGAAR